MTMITNSSSVPGICKSWKRWGRDGRGLAERRGKGSKEEALSPLGILGGLGVRGISPTGRGEKGEDFGNGSLHLEEMGERGIRGL
jgi:hypothetical protein